MNWPNDADGDVVRRLRSQGFDFSQPCTIDFNVDFLEWPPAQAALDLIRSRHPEAIVYPEEGDSAGYVLFQVHDRVTYELVTRVQAEMSALLAPFGGLCESWGVLH
jgi:hypothetical protein